VYEIYFYFLPFCVLVEYVHLNVNAVRDEPTFSTWKVSASPLPAFTASALLTTSWCCVRYLVEFMVKVGDWVKLRKGQMFQGTFVPEWKVMSVNHSVRSVWLVMTPSISSSCSVVVVAMVTRRVREQFPDDDDRMRFHDDRRSDNITIHTVTKASSTYYGQRRCPAAAIL